MPLFRCENCGCIENTALGHYWSKSMKDFKGTEWEKALCSECTPDTFPDGSKCPKGGKWHGKFQKTQATELNKGTLENF